MGIKFFSSSGERGYSSKKSDGGVNMEHKTGENLTLKDWVGKEVRIEFENGTPEVKNVQVVTTLLGVDVGGIFISGTEHEFEFYPFEKISIIFEGRK